MGSVTCSHIHARLTDLTNEFIPFSPQSIDWLTSIFTTVCLYCICYKLSPLDIVSSWMSYFVILKDYLYKRGETCMLDMIPDGWEAQFFSVTLHIGHMLH